MRRLILISLLSILSLAPPAVQANGVVARHQKHQWEILLDSIHPSSDPISGGSKCCPAGYHFDGTRCAITPTCDAGCAYKSGKCVAERQPFCPEGSYLQGNGCVSNKAPSCPLPAILEGDACVSDKPGCGDGFEFDTTIGKCVSSESPQCFHPYKFYKGKCVTDDGPKCPLGMRFRLGNCVSEKEPSCDKGNYTVELSACVGGEPSCPADTLLQGNTCMSKNPPICPQGDEYDEVLRKCVSRELFCDDEDIFEVDANAQCRHRDPPVCGIPNMHASFDAITGTGRCCPNDMEWDGGFCVMSTPPDGCAPHLTQRGDKCLLVSTKQPKCPAKTKLKGNSCVSVEGPRCEFGYDPRNGICVRRENPKCPEDFHFDASEGSCFFKTPVKCDSGSVLRDNVCVLLNVPPRCGFGFIFDSKQCVSDRVPTCGRDSTFDGEACVVSKIPSCKQRYGTSFADGKCVKDVAPTCKTGSLDILGRCVVRPVCEEGVFMNGGCFVNTPSCDRDASYDPVTKSCNCAQNLSCDEGYTLNNGKCEVSAKERVCEQGTTLKGGKCCKKPNCKPGHFWSNLNEICVAGSPRCPEDSILHSDRCGAAVMPSCPAGYILDFDLVMCVQWSEPVCEEGTRFNPRTGDCEDKGICESTKKPPVDGCCPSGGKEECFTVAVKLEDCDAPGTYDSRVRRMQTLQSSLAKSGLDSLDMVISDWRISDGSDQDEVKAPASETPELSASPSEVHHDEVPLGSESEPAPDADIGTHGEEDEGEDDEEEDDEDESEDGYEDIDNPFA